ncbi:MAG TPA: polyketide cyclase / dehydrase and lipid transport [Mycobacteriales bacterium]|nr:polyketide cyclase / dehydrase and lipid transport [Mycobacteriales bacterium]
MPLVDVIDETFVVAPPAVVAAALKDAALWRTLFPDLDVEVHEDRGDEGVRMTVTGALVGSNEFWVEPWCDGAVVHYYLRADPTRRGSATEVATGEARRLLRRAIRLREAHCVRLKAGLNALKDRLEAGRPPGAPLGGYPPVEPPAAKGR